MKSSSPSNPDPAFPAAGTTRLATIDIGTNNILLLIAELEAGGRFRVLEDRAVITRLGEGVDRTRRIAPEAADRSLEALREYVESCRRRGVTETLAVGTSALRDAENAVDFQARLSRELGLEVRVLTGEEEAAYSCLAVLRSLALGDREALVVDVGGGSTEFIWAKQGSIHRLASRDLGSVRLTERFLRSDPPREDEIARLGDAIVRDLEALRSDWGCPVLPMMVGIAGTFTTLVAIAKGLEEYSHGEVHGSEIDRAEVARQIELFQRKTIAERKSIPGLEAGRADVILAGALLIDRLMGLFGIERVTVSDQGIRYGLLYERLDARPR